jgi:ribosomal protein S12 methylthiotransferase
MAASAPRISFVSLGCPKALVDSERIITRLRAEGYALARAANDLAVAIPDDVKEERWHLLMQRQQAISVKRLKRKIGTRQRVIIDEVDGISAKGRSKADAPEIDGIVHVTSRRPLRIGEIATVKIERADQYDLHGSVAGF